MTRNEWLLYALRCADDTLYTGVTTDIGRRLAEHNSGRGARYTAGRRPVRLVGAWAFENQSAAQRAEAQFRRLPRRDKLQHIARRMPVAGSPFSEDVSVCKHLSPLRFCLRCGGLLKSLTRQGDTRRRQVCTACGRVAYRNAKPCAGVLVVREGRLLLVRRAIKPYRGWWDIPGGFLEDDELPAAGAVREVEEETGLRVETEDLFGFYIGQYARAHGGMSCLNIYFLGRVVGGREQPGQEATELGWFAPQELPEAVAFDHAQQVLDDWRTWAADNAGAQRR